MAFKQLAITLTGAVQRLSASLPDTTPGGASDVPCLMVIFAADPANSSVVYIGDSNVAATAHAFALDPTQASAEDIVTIGPFDAGSVRLSDFYCKGTNGERLMIGYVPF